MNNTKTVLLVVSVALVVFLVGVFLTIRVGTIFSSTTLSDLREINTGSIIPSENYSDQPFCLITNDNKWLCVLTTGTGNEGDAAQHIISTISTDQGATWSTPIDIEPSDGPEASWAMPLKVPSGRVYVFYDYNLDGVPPRADMIFPFMFKYSDDNGLSWSSERYEVPIRTTSVDLNNTFGGGHQLGWGVGKPIIVGNSVYIAVSKIGTYVVKNTEGWFLRSDNILTETDPANISWITLPNGDLGLKSPGPGDIAEEHELVSLSDNSLYTIYRTIEGYAAQAYSRDGGHTWSTPEPAKYSPNGRNIKNPRANVSIRKFSNGKYLMWYHNHGGKSFFDRNPGWLASGFEKNGYIYWSEPEVLLYDLNLTTRISYPDFIEQIGQYWITETNKSIARIHKIDTNLIEGLWGQSDNRTVAISGQVLSLDSTQLQSQTTAPMPVLPNLAQGGSFTIDFWVNFADLVPGQIVLDSRDETGKGVVVQTVANNSLEITLNDGVNSDVWNTDPYLLQTNTPHHIVAIVDGSAKITSFILDGVLLDGGLHRQYGWDYLNQNLGNVNGSSTLKLGPTLQGNLLNLRIYDRYLRTSEAVGNYQALATSPNIWITAPANNADVSGIVNITATVSDNIFVSNVEFYVDGTLLSTDTTAPYSASWDTASLAVNSVQTLIAKVYDAAGNVGTSPAVSVKIADVTAPTISITAPLNNATVSGTVSFRATASDNAVVTKVEFYVDGTLLLTDTVAAYLAYWDTTSLAANSIHTLTAKAYDAAGNVGTSPAISVKIADTVAPTTSITAPANNATVSGTVTLNATASDNVAVTKVEFWIDGVLRTTDTATPYVASWNTTFVAHNTTHSLTSKAYDAAGNVTTSAPVNVTVSDITLPTASITSPINNATVPRRSTVTIQATASDISGISKVEFYVGTTLQCTDTTSSYSCAWNVPPQKTTYILTVKAYDVANNVKTSTAITVTAK